MASRRAPALSEIVSVIAITGVMAAAVAISLAVFGERTEDARQAMEDEAARSGMRAAELLAAGHISCTGGTIQFILHNFAPHTANPDSIRVMVAGPDNTVESRERKDVSYTWLNGTQVPAGGLVEHGSSVTVSAAFPCEAHGAQLLLRTPAGGFLAVEP
ncbi:hypothetical protein CENSYa_0698 [Cenarchaeum symbiosum A]|uniref:Uncharacterized protein n=1 Tax=Cenarchaeum symbiosum (strain A) TaxID=414004 RepID=A0RVG4_CENSY|nr:hypothetical protein CENSYa_0698 [Cenarchaeum symbiosum A]